MSEVKVTVEVAAWMEPVIKVLKQLGRRIEELTDVEGLESAVEEGLKEADRVMMEGALRRKAEEMSRQGPQEVRCGQCKQGWAVLREAAAPRWALTVRGRVDFHRPVYRCAQCEHERCVVDEQLGLGPKQHLTSRVQSKVAWAGTMLSSYDKAHQAMSRLADLEISVKEVHRTTDQIGARALELQDEEVRQRGAPGLPEAPIPVEERPETVVLEMDGTCAMGRDGAGHEIKCATVFGLDARAKSGSPGKERPILLRRCYCATGQGIRAFSAMVWALLSWWGGRSAKRLVVIGDGIDWIWNFSADRLHFKLADGTVQKPIEIVDFWHAAENLAKARGWIFKDPESPPATKWFERWRDVLRQGRIEEIIAELTRRAREAQEGVARKELEVRCAYFQNHQDRMRYPKFEAMELPIGSGAIEGTCKNLIKGRLDGPGMRWDPDNGLERITALRVRAFNNTWNDLFANAHNPILN